MTTYQFIYSDESSVRVKRHFVFWSSWYLYFTMLHAAAPFNKEIAYFKNLPFTLTESFLLLVPHLLLTYYLIYFILPTFLLKNKYWQAVVCTIPFLLFCLILNLYMVLKVNPKVLAFLLPERYLVNTGRHEVVSFFMSLLNTSKGAFVVAAMGLGIKFIKHWYQKEQRNLQLQKENAEAQLQLLTAQVHPHFLFNTLNNIYSQVQTESPKGSRMILELSDLLRYVLAEGTKNLVPLKKELVMIKNYINLEKVRYGNKLELHTSLPEDTGTLGISPLILLPFLENCFKHGASRFLKSPWINLKIQIIEDKLIMKLMNGKDSLSPAHFSTTGTGLNNVKKRLELLYQDRYTLDIIDEEDAFIVNLSLRLKSLVSSETVTEITNKQVSYA